MAEDHAVEDVAGNPSTAFSSSFQFDADDCLLHNDELPQDTNFDGRVTPLDALPVLNHLRRRIENTIDEMDAQDFPAYDVDVNCDGEITPLDALQVLNQYRRDRIEALDRALERF